MREGLRECITIALTVIIRLVSSNARKSPHIPLLLDSDLVIIIFFIFLGGWADFHAFWLFELKE